MKRTKLTILSAVLAGGLSAGGWVGGCSTDPVEQGPPAQSLGSVGVDLVIGAGVSVDRVDYAVTGPAGFSRTGSIDVSNSATVSAIISGIPFGAGYRISLRGTTADGLGVCTGSASFDIAGTTQITVPVDLACDLQPQTGSVLVDGTVNACPRIDGVGASPASVAVNGTIALSSTVVDVDHGPSALTYSWTATGGSLAGATTANPTFTCTAVGPATITLAASDGDTACASQQSVDVICTEPQAASPIKHVIVLIGENRSFDHAFGTYVPRSGETISNLLSKGIVNADGTPGPNFALSAQMQVAPQGAYYISAADKTPYTTLPPPSTSSAPSAQRPTAPPFQNVAQAAFETDIFPADLNLVTTGATGLPAKSIDTRVPNAANLPNGVFQLTSATLPYDSYTGDVIHRFYQMWQQEDCSAASASLSNPSGCLADLFSFTAISFSTADNGVGSSMGFTNVQNGDMPFLTMLANGYTLSDNMHQSVMGGTGANHALAGFGDALFWADGTGVGPGTPPASLIANPNPKAGTNNNYTLDGAFTNCADTTQSGVAPIVAYLASLPWHPSPNCAAGAYYYLNNTNPTYDPHGKVQTGNLVPPTLQRSIATALDERGISWKFYGGGFNTNSGYCQICNPFEYQLDVMSNPVSVAAHMKDTTDMFTDIANGTLPSVSYAHPDGVMDGHPSSSKLDLYESYVKNILVKLQANQALAASTAVMVTFDEGGGYYDSGFVQPVDYFGDGTRIPLIIVSPYTTGGHVNHGYADHVSILKFIERNWSLNPISARSRDNLPNPQTNAGDPYVPTNMPALTDLWDAFDFSKNP